MTVTSRVISMRLTFADVFPPEDTITMQECVLELTHTNEYFISNEYFKPCCVITFLHHFKHVFELTNNALKKYNTLKNK